MAERKKKRKRGEGPLIEFDVAGRHEFLTGFKKRKDARRKKAVMEILEKERQDRIEVRKEHREEVKRRWKEVAWAERRAEKVLQLGSFAPGKPKAIALAEEAKEDLDLEEEKPEITGFLKDAPVAVVFEEEDDDPFGGCQVTTTAVDLMPAGGGQSYAMVRAGGDAAGELPLVLARPKSDPAKRAQSLAKEEARRQVSLKKKAIKRIEEMKKLGRKKKRKPKRDKGKKKKTGAKERRKRKVNR